MRNNQAVLVHSLYPRTGVSLLVVLIAELLQSNGGKVAVVEAPNVTDITILMDLQLPVMYKDYRDKRSIDPISKDGIDYFPCRSTLSLPEDSQMEALLQLLGRLQNYNLVLIDGGSLFFNEAVLSSVGQVWTILDPDFVKLSYVFQHGTNENAIFMRIKELVRNHKVIMNKSSRVSVSLIEEIPNLLHIPLFSHDSLQSSLWSLEWPVKNKELSKDINSSLRDLALDWLPKTKEKRGFFGKGK
jgi:hypothetical protein